MPQVPPIILVTTMAFTKLSRTMMLLVVGLATIGATPIPPHINNTIVHRQLQSWSYRNGRRDVIPSAGLSEERGTRDTHLHCTFASSACTLLDAVDELSTFLTAAAAYSSCATPCVCCAITIGWGELVHDSITSRSP